MMPEVNLATMSGPELRRLLNSCRERGQAALSYQILQEMAARREKRPRRGLIPARRPAEPRIVALDLGDPREASDDLPPMPKWRPPPQAKAATPGAPKAPAAPKPPTAPKA